MDNTPHVPTEVDSRWLQLQRDYFHRNREHEVAAFAGKDPETGDVIPFEPVAQNNLGLIALAGMTHPDLFPNNTLGSVLRGAAIGAPIALACFVMIHGSKNSDSR